jgi:hypothetical protein
MTQRWRYQDINGRAIWLAFDPAFPCIFCDKPVVEMSMGGPAVCPMCDCGYSNGHKWTLEEFRRFANNARHRLVEISDDPIWAEYEKTSS